MYFIICMFMYMYIYMYMYSIVFCFVLIMCIVVNCPLFMYNVAYVELPDGKVLSGTEWGNLLLWDGGFIKVELAKKGKKLCHNVRCPCVQYQCIQLL